MPTPMMTSYLLAACAVPLVLHFHLLPAVFAGSVWVFRRRQELVHWCF